MSTWYGMNRYTQANCMIPPAESSNAFNVINTVTSAFNATQLKHVAIALSYTRSGTAIRDKWRASLPNVQSAKEPTPHEAMPARQERKSWKESSKQSKISPRTGQYFRRIDPWTNPRRTTTHGRGLVKHATPPPTELSR